MKYRFKKLKEQSAFFLLFEFLKIKFLRLLLLTFKQATLELLHETRLKDEPKSFHVYIYILKQMGERTCKSPSIHTY